MLRLFFGLLFIFNLTCALGQQHSIGVGVYSGFTIPYTWDSGIDKDPRYNNHYSLKGAPIGLAFMKDFEGFGFVISPGMYSIGQDYNVVNNEGGHDGHRDITMRYIMLPVAFKLHVIELDFFRVSATASLTGSYLYDMDDKLTHSVTKLLFPSETYPYLPEGYSVEYDGVITPEVNDMDISVTDDYNSFHLFAGLGLRADWDVSDHWRVSIDARMNFGIFEPRNDEYMGRINSYQSIYDYPGDRREMFAAVTFGIGRFLDFDAGEKERAKKRKGTRRVYVPQKSSKRKPSGPRK